LIGLEVQIAAKDKAPPTYARSHRVVEILSIVVVFGTLAAMGLRVTRALITTGDWIYLGFTALTGYLTADFLSGVVHWAGDTLGDESTPFLGRNFVLPFRQHHINPKDISRHDFVETNGNNCIVVLAPLSLAYWLLPDDTGFGFFAATLMGFLALFIVATNQFHKWAHADAPPRVAVVLQRWGLILSADHHNIHHAQPHDRHYCITVGWMNPLLNRIGFFRTAEGLVAAIRPGWLHLEERRLYLATVGAHDDDQVPAPAAAGLGRPRPL
jgi:plasmanylethanolamine desaturase